MLLVLLLSVVLARGRVQVGQRGHVARVVVMIDEDVEVVLLALRGRRGHGLLLDADEVVNKLLLVVLLIVELFVLVLLLAVHAQVLVVRVGQIGATARLAVLVLVIVRDHRDRVVAAHRVPVG